VIDGRYQPNVQPKYDSDKDASERSLSKFNATSPRTMNRIERKIGVKVTLWLKKTGQPEATHPLSAFAKVLLSMRSGEEHVLKSTETDEKGRLFLKIC